MTDHGEDVAQPQCAEPGGQVWVVAVASSPATHPAGQSGIDGVGDHPGGQMRLGGDPYLLGNAGHGVARRRGRMPASAGRCRAWVVWVTKTRCTAT